ncbi:MAG: stage II sporulation protein P [Lachnospiraceae bacterium]|nr:stage II sporulation protein P [Lachnospiraceae bacterium]
MPSRPRFARLKINLIKWSIITLLIITLVMIVVNGFKDFSKDGQPVNFFYDEIRDSLTKQMALNVMPLLSFLENPNRVIGFTVFIETSLNKQIPLLYLSGQELSKEPDIEDAKTRDILIRMEGRDEDSKNIIESELDYTEDALHIDDSILESLLSENQPRYNPGPNEGEGEISLISPNREPFTAPLDKAFAYDWAAGFTYEELINNFYAIDPTTHATEAILNLDSLRNRDLRINKEVNGPQILIYHTHSLEGFSDSIPGDESTTIVGAGARLAEILTEKYGFEVLHHTTGYDLLGRDYAYSNALPDIEELLKENPSIQVVIDLHRDEMKEGRKLVMDLGGRPTAQFMFFNGLSYTRQTGPIEYLENPYINENLAFSFQAQVAANEYYPGITRKIYLRAYRYNMHVLPRTTLIELGAQTNTVEEIMNACEPLAHVLSLVLN